MKSDKIPADIISKKTKSVMKSTKIPADTASKKTKITTILAMEPFIFEHLDEQVDEYPIKIWIIQNLFQTNKILIKL